MQAKTRLDRAAVIRAAAELADAEGMEQLTLARLAEHLGIRSPSLYNHVASLDDLRRHLALLGLHELSAQLGRAVMGKAADEAVAALAQAYRAFAREHPALYIFAIHPGDSNDQEIQRAARAAVDVVVAVLAPYGLQDDDAIHAVRVLRSALHGFVSLETAGGFGMSLNLDESFRRLVQNSIGGLHQTEDKP